MPRFSRSAPLSRTRGRGSPLPHGFNVVSIEMNQVIYRCHPLHGNPVVKSVCVLVSLSELDGLAFHAVNNSHMHATRANNFHVLANVFRIVHDALPFTVTRFGQRTREVQIVCQ
jgi:hypothetical protein